MNSYQGTLRVTATSDVIDAVFDVDAESLRVRSGGEELGVWPLTEIFMQHSGDGLLLDLAGEQVVVNLSDERAFVEAISASGKRRRKPKSQRKQKVRPERRSSSRRPRVPKAAPDRTPEALGEPVPEIPEEHLPDDPMDHVPEAAPVHREVEREMVPDVEQEVPLPGPDRSRRAQLPQRNRLGFIDRMKSIGELFDGDNWSTWLQEPKVMWSIAAAVVVTLGLMALFATSTLGMIMILVGMVVLIVAALAMSEDLTAYRFMPRLRESTVVLAGAGLMALGAVLVVVG